MSVSCRAPGVRSRLKGPPAHDVKPIETNYDRFVAIVGTRRNGLRKIYAQKQDRHTHGSRSVQRIYPA